MVSFKKKSESLIKYYIKVTCALKWARKLPRKTETYESAKCVPCNTRKCTHNGFISDLLKWALKCRFYATGPCRTAVNREGNDDADELRIFLETMEEGIFNFNQRGSNGDFKQWLILELIWLNMIRREVHLTSRFPKNWMAKKRSSTWKTNTTNALNGAWQGLSILSQYIRKGIIKLFAEQSEILTEIASKSLSSSKI